MENIELSTLIADTKIDLELLKRLGVEKILNQNIGSLSGGQQQRISIARILSKKPKIIFADEPTGNLDSQTAQNVMEILFDYIKEHEASLFLVSHDENLARQCDQIYELKEQKLLAI